MTKKAPKTKASRIAKAARAKITKAPAPPPPRRTTKGPTVPFLGPMELAEKYVGTHPNAAPTSAEIEAAGTVAGHVLRRAERRAEDRRLAEALATAKAFKHAAHAAYATGPYPPLPGPARIPSAPSAELWAALEEARLVLGTDLAWPTLVVTCDAMAEALCDRMDHAASCIGFSLLKAVETGSVDEFRVAHSAFAALDAASQTFLNEMLCGNVQVRPRDIRCMVTGVDNAWAEERDDE